MNAQNPGHAVDVFPKIRTSKAGTFVSFSSEPNEFHMQVMACNNPDCICSDGTLSFVEVGDDAVPIQQGKAFSVRMDLSAWQELGHDEGPEEIRKLIEELRGAPDNPVRAWIAEQRRLAKEEKERIEQYRLNAKDVRERILVSYSDILEEEGGIRSGGGLCSFVLPHEGVEYGIEELYCPNPDCNCKEVHLFFWGPKQDPDKKAITLHFRGTMTLRGRMEIEECFEISEKQARKVMKALRQEVPDLPELAKKHYRIVKEVGHRSIQDDISSECPSKAVKPQGGRYQGAGSTTTIVDLFRKESKRPSERKALEGKKRKPGRNQPCPCGSGKKHKKCCGK
jgi:hypothetical protein